VSDCGCSGYSFGCYNWLTPDRSTVINRNVLVTAPTEEPITLDEAKLAAGLDWPSGDPRDAQMTGFIAAARERVERDTGLALLTQTRDVYLSGLIAPQDWPAPVQPLQSILSVDENLDDGTRVALPSDAWTTAPGAPIKVKPGKAAAAVAAAVPPNTPPEFDPVYPYIVRVIVGWTTVAEIPPLLTFAVGLLTAHYATAGRDIVALGERVAALPMGYEDAIADYRRVAV
jgi:uncharacterized phiE125 gp8 family phage protein